MNNKYRLNDEAVIFGINTVPVIGETKTGKLMNITNESLEIIKRILRGNEIEVTSLNEIEKRSLYTLQKYGFIENEYEEKNSCDSTIEIVNLSVCQDFYLEDKFIISLNRLLTQLKEGNRCVLNVLYNSYEERRTNTNQASSNEKAQHTMTMIKELLRVSKEHLKVNNVNFICSHKVITENLLDKVKPLIDQIIIEENILTSDLKAEDYFIAFDPYKGYIENAEIPFNILISLNKFNIRHIKKYIAMAKDMKIDIKFSMVDKKELNPTEEQLLDFAPDIADYYYDICHIIDKKSKLYAQKSCAAGVKIINIDSEGYVYPCHRLKKVKYRMGNIISNSLDEIFNSKNITRFKELSVDTFSNCSSCQYKYLCGGGCRATAYLSSSISSSSLEACDYYCTINKSMYEKIFKCVEKAAIDQNPNKDFF